MKDEIRFENWRLRRETEEFREIRARLKTAVRRVEVPDRLEQRLRIALAEAPRARSWPRHPMAVTAGIVLAMGTWLAYRAADVLAIPHARAAAILRVGLGQHIRCALSRPPAEPADPPETNLRNLAEYRGLLPVVRERVPRPFQLLTAHKCRFAGREFVHFTFRDGAKLLSILLTRKRGGEGFAARRSMYTAGVQSYQVAGFETRDHLVYVVSRLPASGNRRIAAALAPAVREVLARIEG
jgi:hypothetical protein